MILIKIANFFFTKSKIERFWLVLIILNLVLSACSNASVTPNPTPVTTRPTPAVTTKPGETQTIAAIPVPDTEAPSQPFNYKADKTFIFGVAQEPVGLNWKSNPSGTGVGFDPANLSDRASLIITRQVYETLFEFKPKSAGYQYTPFLIKNVIESEDGLSYTIRLRKGLRFSDGTLLDAEAIKFNFLRWSNPASIYHKGDFPTWQRYFGSFPGNLDIDNLQVLDHDLIKIVLKQPMASFYQVLSMPQFGLISPSAFDAKGYFIPSKPIGSGPYKIERQERGDAKYVVLTRNPAYTIERDEKSLPPRNLDTLVVQVLKDKQDVYKELREGRITATDKIRPEEVMLAANQKDPIFEIKQRPPLNLSFLSFNVSRPPFNQLEVRQAFAYAINTKAIIRDYYNGMGSVAASFLPPDVFASRSDLQPYPYDPDKAKQLLLQSNYLSLQAAPLELWVLPVPRLYYPDPSKIADAIISDLAKVGVPVLKRNSDTWVDFRQNRSEGKYSFFMNGWQGESGDPDEFMSQFWLNQTRETGYDNKVLRDNVEGGLAEIDPLKRRPFYVDAQGIIYNDFAVIPLAYTQWPVAIRRDIVGYEPHPTGIESWAYLSFK